MKSMKAKPAITTSDQFHCKQLLADWRGGEHHLAPIQPWGDGISMLFSGDLSTYDFNNLTALVVLAHARAVRVSIQPAMRSLRIILHKRISWTGAEDATPTIYDRHPNTEMLKHFIDTGRYM